jgi:galactose mutarotase-like enzyme
LLQLTKDGAKALILPERGGLLISLALQVAGKKDNPEAQELLWLPLDFDTNLLSSSGWPGGGAPWLFPFAGRVFHVSSGGLAGQYELRKNPASEPQTYNMPIHGFAYGARWQVTESSTSSATLEWASDEASRQLYPFDFHLTTRYELAADSLRCSLEVKAAATNTGPMPVAAGMHPYFKIPFSAQSAWEQVRLKCDAKEEIRVTPAGAAGKASPAPAPFSATLADPLVHNLILGKLQSQTALLRDKTAKQALAITAQPASAMQHWVLWGKPEQGFYCLEPWMGLPDAVHTGAGCKWMEPTEVLNLLVSIELRQD